MNNKQILGFGFIILFMLVALVATSKGVDAKKPLCDFANPPQGCYWNIQKGYPKCQAELVCPGGQL